MSRGEEGKAVSSMIAFGLFNNESHFSNDETGVVTGFKRKIGISALRMAVGVDSDGSEGSVSISLMGRENLLNQLDESLRRSPDLSFSFFSRGSRALIIISDNQLTG